MRAGLPVPEVNRAIYDADGNWLGEPDLHYKWAKLALEYNGAQHAQVDRMRRDITRTLTVIGGDWLTVAFGPAEVFGRPHSLAPYVRSLLDRRAPGWWRRAPLNVR